MLSLLAQLFKALNSENSTRQIALALVLSLIFALSPIISLQAFVILFIVLIVRVHLASFILGATVFEGIAFIMHGLNLAVGEWLLTSSATHGLFEGLYQFDWFKLAHWHHTHNLGALVVGVLLAMPSYWLFSQLIIRYRDNLKAYIERLAIVKALKATRVFQIYQQLPSSGDR